MPDLSPRLSLPFLMPSQAQKHVTHNAALELLDALVQLSVLSRDLATPPTDPAEGAAFQNGAWALLTPQVGWAAHVGSEGRVLYWDGAAWGLAGMDNLPGIGINAGSDATNWLALAAAASLFSHDGAGHLLKVNKAAPADTASLLFQTGWSGRAEMGLAETDESSLKVSADGSSWTTALSVDAASGTLSGAAEQAAASDVTAGRLARADYAYGPGNLLGAVGETGGVPTGAVIERGTNGNGEYVRFADGTQLCGHSLDAGDTKALGAGTWADPYRSVRLTWDFPVAFIDVPAGFSAVCRTDANSIARIQYLVRRYLTSAQASQMQVVRGSSSNTDSVSAPTTVHLTAVGRWF